MLIDWLWRDVAYRILVGVTSGLAIGRLLGFLLFEFPRENALAKTEAGVFAMAGVLIAYGTRRSCWRVTVSLPSSSPASHCGERNRSTTDRGRLHNFFREHRARR